MYHFSGPTNQPTYLPTYLPTNLPTNLPTYQPTNLPTYQPITCSFGGDHSAGWPNSVVGGGTTDRLSYKMSTNVGGREGSDEARSYEVNERGR